MGSEIAIVGLAAVTIVGTLIVAIVHFGFHMRDPKNLEAVKRVAQDRESATTKSADNQGRPNKPLLQRLDESEASIKR